MEEMAGVCAPPTHTHFCLPLALLATILVAASGGREPLCPSGFYRENVLVWPCEVGNETLQFETEVLIGVGSAEELGEIPIDLKTPAIGVQSAVPGKFEILNSGDAGVLCKGKTSITQVGERRCEDRNILVSELGKKSYPWSGMTVTDVVLSRAPYQESVHLFGVTPNLLNVRVGNNGTKEAVFVVSYSFEGYSNGTCPSRIPGCAWYDAARSAAAVDKFSEYLMKEYNNFYWAWTSMPGGSHRAEDEKSVRQLNAENISWYQWKAIWKSWPTSGKSSSMWKETFRFIDAFLDEDGVLSRAEFRKAFYFHRVYPSLSAWSGELHGAVNGKTAVQAWAAFSQGEVNITRSGWESKWDNFLLPADVEKASTEDVLDFFDTDGDGFITELEFTTAYTTFYGGKPIMLAGLNMTVTTVTTTQAASTDDGSNGSNATAVADDEGEDGSTEHRSSGLSSTMTVYIIVGSAAVGIILIVAIVMLVQNLCKPKGKKKFQREAKRNSREVSGFYEPVTPSEAPSAAGESIHHERPTAGDCNPSPASLQPVDCPPADHYFPGPYEQQPRGGQNFQQASTAPPFFGGPQSSLSSVSLTPASSWNYGQAYPGSPGPGGGNMGRTYPGSPSQGGGNTGMTAMTPLRYAMPNDPSDERSGVQSPTSYQRPAYGEQGQSSFQSYQHSFQQSLPQRYSMSGFGAEVPPLPDYGGFGAQLDSMRSFGGQLPDYRQGSFGGYQPPAFDQSFLGQPPAFAQPYIGPV